MDATAHHKLYSAIGSSCVTLHLLPCSAAPGQNIQSRIWEEADGKSLLLCCCKPVVHNLFRPRATNRSLKPFGGQTGVTTLVRRMFVKMYEDDVHSKTHG